MTDQTGAAAGSDNDLIELSTEIVSAYVSHNALSLTDLPKLISDVHNALKGLRSEGAPEPVEELKPAVPVRKSVAPDYIICLEDGKHCKAMKRHLGAKFGLTPAAYRKKWGLPDDYPMTAPNSRLARSALAKRIGLGVKSAAPAAKAPAKRAA